MQALDTACEKINPVLNTIMFAYKGLETTHYLFSWMVPFH